MRVVVSLLVVGHLAAVTVAPFAILLNSRFAPRAVTPAPPPLMERVDAPSRPPNRPQPVILRLDEIILPYLDLLYLNHGYSFFAPEPTASYVMEYEIEKEDGETVLGRLPDLDRHWPRLLYHRYFMLASQNFELTGRAMAGEQTSVLGAHAPRGATDTPAHAIAKHLHETEGGKRTVLRLLVHRLLWPEEVQQGKRLDAPETYVPVGEIVYPPSGSFEELGAARRGDTIAIAEEVRP